MMKRLFTTMTKPNLFYHKELVVMLYGANEYML